MEFRRFIENAAAMQKEQQIVQGLLQQLTTSQDQELARRVLAIDELREKFWKPIRDKGYNETPVNMLANLRNLFREVGKYPQPPMQPVTQPAQQQAVQPVTQQQMR